MATQPHNSLREMSQYDWIRDKDEIINQYSVDNKSAKAIASWLKGKGYRTSERAVRGHLSLWSVALKYRSSEDWESHCQHLLNEMRAGTPLDLAGSEKISQLRRWCRDHPNSPAAAEMLEMLRSPFQRQAQSEEAETEGFGHFFGEDVSRARVGFTGDASWLTESLSHDQAPDQDLGRHEKRRESGSRQRANLGGSSTQALSLPEAIHRAPLHFSDHLGLNERILELSHVFYSAKLADIGASETSGSELCTQLFRHIKNGIWYLKQKDRILAKQELDASCNVMGHVCQHQPFAMLKECFATLSSRNTSIFPALRKRIFQLLLAHTNKYDTSGPRSILPQILRLLAQVECSNDLAQRALQAMYENSMILLPFYHDEVFGLQRAIIRIYRRCHDYDIAAHYVRALLEYCEQWHGLNDVRTRLAIGEQVYVLMDQGSHEDALAMAKDILRRARLDLGDKFPDDRSIYTFEDAADICDRLGRTGDAVEWLRKALHNAIEVWANSTQTHHILKKLNQAEDRRYAEAQKQMAAIRDAW